MSGPRSKSAAVQSLPWPRAGLPFAVCAAALIAILIEWRLLSTVAQPSQFEEIPTATCDASDLGYRCMYGVPDSGYYVHWNAPVNNTVNMAVRANANSWIGIGWNSQNEMKGAVAAVGINFQVLQRYLYDYKAELIRPYSGLFAPESPTSIERQGANLTMRFTRVLNEDLPWTTGPVFTLYASKSVDESVVSDTAEVFSHHGIADSDRGIYMMDLTTTPTDMRPLSAPSESGSSSPGTPVSDTPPPTSSGVPSGGQLQSPPPKPSPTDSDSGLDNVQSPGAKGNKTKNGAAGLALGRGLQFYLFLLAFPLAVASSLF